MTTSPEFKLIASEEALIACCEKLSHRPYIALDTEFLRENTYRPELCLLQLKSDDILAAVDTIAINDLSPLSALLHDASIVKVFHAASQDLEIFYWLDRKVPSPLFDTQLAAPLLGHNEQIGYGNLVKEMLGVELPKSHTRADWTRRPLPEQQLKYAIDDVVYLEKIYLQQIEALKKRQRLSWLDVEFEALTDPDKYNKPARDIWKKMRAAQKLKGGSLATFQALAEWREFQARERNLPRSWIIKDDVLADIARQLPTSVDELGHIRGLGSKTHKRYADKLVDLIQLARGQQPEPLPAYIRKTKITHAQNAVVDVLSAYVNARASEVDISPGLLASRKMLENCVATGSTDSLSGWRQPLLGEQIQALLDGKSLLGVSDGKLTILDSSDP